jgi:hypothetical protein
MKQAAIGVREADRVRAIADAARAAA